MSISKKSKKMSLKALMDKVIATLSERSQEIVRFRFGVGEKSKTLNEIGNKYGITRERVRQIIRESVAKIQKKEMNNVLSEIKEKMLYTINANSGIIEREEMLDVFGDSIEERGSAEFFLECLKDVKIVEKRDEIKKSFALAGFDVEKWKKVKNAAKDILKKEKSTFNDQDFYAKFKSVYGKSIKISEKEFLSYLKVSCEIKRNNFGKWGIINWSEISPRGARQKSLLVMKELKKPLHFREVAQMIDEYGLSKKKTHPQTVHNELIKDKRFVLVGRGVYALAEWGYKKGTVKDVIEDILKKNNKPMRKNEIVSKALEVRKVKKSTVVINLNSFFEKIDEDTYAIKK